MSKNLNVPTLLDGVFGEICCRQRIGEWKSIHLGFGRKIHHDKNTIDAFYGEWELGTYSSNWEIYCKDSLLLTSKNNNESNDELDILLQEIFFGRLEEIELLETSNTVKLSFSSKISMYFYEILEESESEVIHFFIPNNLYIEFNPIDGWKIEKTMV